jgi:hypothetical protein
MYGLANRQYLGSCSMLGYTADYWAAHAAESRKIAALMRNEDARKAMLSAAARCEELADIARQSQGAAGISA